MNDLRHAIASRLCQIADAWNLADFLADRRRFETWHRQPTVARALWRLADWINPDHMNR